MPLWDRTKYLLLLFLLFWWFVWSKLADNPLMSVRDAIALTLESAWWLFVLAGVELLRQFHYLVSERSAAYHGWWLRRYSGFERRVGKMNDWNRFRIARALKLLLFLALLSIALGALFDVSPAIALFQLPARLFAILPFVLQLAFGFFFVMFQFIGLFWFLSRGGVDVYFPDDIKTRFTDVWGQDHVMERVKENMVFLENPDAIEAKGGYVPGGLLLYGPPGTGKTLMAEAVAGETGRPFVFVEPGAFINMFMGVGILKVKGLFRKLRRLALRYGGVVVFFDEADALGNRGGGQGGDQGPAGSSPFTQSCNGLHYLSRPTLAELASSGQAVGQPRGTKRNPIIMGGMAGGGGGMGTLQALLTELSGLKKPRGLFNRYVRRAFGMRPKPPPKYRIMVMMATNRPDVLDEALLRPGRIDRIYKVGYPSSEGRERTFVGYLGKVKHELTPEQVRKLAVISPYATGATIKDMVNEALVYAIRDERDTIGWSDIIKAKHLKSLGPPDDQRYVDREQHAVAVHEACHAVAAYRLRKRNAIDVATIEHRGETLGMVASVPLEDQFTDWRSHKEADVMVSLASLAGERLFFDGDNSTGVSADLRNATRVTMTMEAFVGMGETIASHSVTIAQIGRPLGGMVEDGSDRAFLETELGRRVERRLALLRDRVRALLEENRRHVLAVAHALETCKTISGDDVVAIIEGHTGPLIDGRVYLDAEVQEALERYHEAVLVAHREEGRVALPLPVFNGQRAATVGIAAATSQLPSFFPSSPPEMPDGGGNGGHHEELAEQRALLNAIAQRLGIDPGQSPHVPPSPPLLPGPPVAVDGQPAPGGNGEVADPHPGEPAAWPTPPPESPDSTDNGDED
jgi:ATP-dependent Zn protease